MAHALSLARQAAAMGEVPVGAVVVRDGQVIGAGFNRREVDKDPTAHAELLAIRQAAQHIGDWRLDGCTLFVTLEPCAMCTGAMVLARVGRCVYGCTDPKGGFMGTLGNLHDDPRLNHRLPVTPGVCGEESAALLRSFFRRLRSSRG
ncbi:tRNA adenosine(34) deaminase TadA [Myxococcota bacterium]|nr:tRNA adenosine(34) deaminase TadA [Myxococcota bacterium]